MFYAVFRKFPHSARAEFKRLMHKALGALFGVSARFAHRINTNTEKEKSQKE